MHTTSRGGDRTSPKSSPGVGGNPGETLKVFLIPLQCSGGRLGMLPPTAPTRCLPGSSKMTGSRGSWRHRQPPLQWEAASMRGCPRCAKHWQPLSEGLNHVFSSCTFGRQEARRSMLQGADAERQKRELKEVPAQICLSFLFGDAHGSSGRLQAGLTSPAAHTLPRAPRAQAARGQTGHPLELVNSLDFAL